MLVWIGLALMIAWYISAVRLISLRRPFDYRTVTAGGGVSLALFLVAVFLETDRAFNALWPLLTVGLWIAGVLYLFVLLRWLSTRYENNGRK